MKLQFYTEHGGRNRETHPPPQVRDATCRYRQKSQPNGQFTCYSRGLVLHPFGFYCMHDGIAASCLCPAHIWLWPTRLLVCCCHKPVQWGQEELCTVNEVQLSGGKGDVLLHVIRNTAEVAVYLLIACIRRWEAQPPRLWNPMHCIVWRSFGGRVVVSDCKHYELSLVFSHWCGSGREPSCAQVLFTHVALCGRHVDAPVIWRHH